MSTERIYVVIKQALLTLPEAERQLREIALSVLLDAGITSPDIESYASPRAVTDEDEEVIRSVRVTMRFSGGSGEDGSLGRLEEAMGHHLIEAQPV